MGFAAGDTNLYRFVSNRPTIATDPSGQFIQFSDRKVADAFAEEMKSKYGAKHISIVQGKRTTYVVIDARDRAAVFKYADDKFGKVFVPLIPGKGKEAIIEEAKKRNEFLVAAGVFGSIADPDLGINLAGRDDYEFEPVAVAEIRKIEKKLIEDKALPSCILNIGGEGQKWEPEGAININVSGLTSSGGQNPIPNFFARTDFKSDFQPIPGRSADQIVLISVPLGPKTGLPETASEVARLIKPGGAIVIYNPDSDTARAYAKVFSDAVGKNAGIMQEVVTFNDVKNILRTTITVKQP